MKQEVPFPLLGLSDDLAYSKQPQATTRNALNVRALDEPTGRTRGAVRSGLTRLSSTTVNGADKSPRFGTSLIYDARKVAYTGITADASNDEVKWALQRRKPCYAGTVDSRSNVYGIDGNATVSKYNKTGTLQWSVALPVPDDRYLCKTIAVDDFGIVYVGTSSGGVEEGTRLFALREVEVGKAEVLWEIETGAYVIDCKVYKGRLITLQSNNSTGESWVVGYDGITTLSPAESFRSKASHPCNSLAVGVAGNIYVSAEETTTNRGRDPRSTISGRITEDWKLSDLIDIKTRIWSEFDPATLVDIPNGGDVSVWNDSSGNGRDLYQKVGFEAPTVISNSLGRLPAVYFQGSLSGTPPVLVSGTNANTSSAYADQQRTMLPAYKDEASASGYTNNMQTVVFMLLRPRRTLTSASKGMGFFRQYMNGSSTAGGYGHYLVFNTQSDSVRIDNATSTDGYVRWHCGSRDGTIATGWNNGGGTGNSVAAALPSVTASGCVLVTVVLNHGTSGAGTDHPSQLRVNGTVIDEWDLKHSGGGAVVLGHTLASTEIGSTDFGDAANFDGFEGTVHYMAVLNRYASNTNSAPCSYPFTQNSGSATFTPDTTGDSELERIEGWIAHRFGVAHILHSSHPFTDTKGTPNRSGITAHSQPWLLNQNYQTLAKYSPAGDLRWVATSFTAYRGTFTAQGISGIGYGVAVDSEGGVYTMGAHQLPTSPPNDYTQLRKIIDLGDSYTATANVTSATGGGGTPTSATSAWGKTYNDYTEQVAVTNQNIATGYHYPRVNCDTLNNVYFPWSATTGTFLGVACIAYDKTGGNGLTGNRAITGNNGLDLTFGQNCYVAIPDPAVPVFDSSTISGSNQDALPRAEFVWLFTDLGSGGAGFFTEETVHRVRLLTVGATTGSPRTQVVLTVCDGAIKKGLATISAPATTIPLSSATTWVDGATAFGRAYFTDRVGYFEYNPKTDVVAEYKATKGVIPPRCSLMLFWRGRMVVARSADDGHIWHMSKQGDVYDWDLGPPVPTSTQAVDGTSSGRIGRCPDIINSIFDLSDDVLVVGCDHSIWTLTGDPQAGGEFDLRSNAVGMTFGRGRTSDPNSNLYFFGTLGGVFRMSPGGQIENITLRSIQRRLEAVDFSKYHIHLEWDYENRGLRVFQLPYDSGTIAPTPYPAVRGWFWDERTGGWWEDQYGVTGNKVQPTCVFTVDGDASGDRMMVFGSEDGFLRYVDPAARNDDATAGGATVPIATTVDIGPVWLAENGSAGRITAVTAEMSSTQGHAVVDLFASDVADSMGVAKASFEAAPGRNPRRLVRAKGAYAWIRMRSAKPNNRWAVERLEFEVHPAGRIRVTS